MTSGLGIDKLLEWIEKIWLWLIPWVVVDHYEQAVVLRFGNFARVLTPGFHLVWPVGVEDIITENIKPDGLETDAQSITLKDGNQITISYVILWEISDIKQLILEVEDKETVQAAMQGYVQEYLRRYSLSELRKDQEWAAGRTNRHGLREKLTKHVREEVIEWSGVYVRDILIRDFVITSFKDGVLRLI